MNDYERKCILTLDEMSLKQRVDFDKSTGSIFGRSTLGDDKEIASHGLVFMLSGKWLAIGIIILIR